MSALASKGDHFGRLQNGSFVPEAVSMLRVGLAIIRLLILSDSIPFVTVKLPPHFRDRHWRVGSILESPIDEVSNFSLEAKPPILFVPPLLNALGCGNGNCETGPQLLLLVIQRTVLI